MTNRAEAERHAREELAAARRHVELARKLLSNAGTAEGSILDRTLRGVEHEIARAHSFL